MAWLGLIERAVAGARGRLAGPHYGYTRVGVAGRPAPESRAVPPGECVQHGCPTNGSAFAIYDAVVAFVGGDPSRAIEPDEVPRVAGGGALWSVDHLTGDQDAVPTLVEVKRGSNPEVRRTIVGQMLEYAAHAAETWTVEELREAFERGTNEDGRDPGDELAAFWGRTAQPVVHTASITAPLHRSPRCRMPELGPSGSVGAGGGKPLSATRPAS